MGDYDWEEMARRVRNNEIPNGDLSAFLRALYQLGIDRGSGRGPDEMDTLGDWVRQQVYGATRT